jgi:hypothetical protein
MTRTTTAPARATGSAKPSRLHGEPGSGAPRAPAGIESAPRSLKEGLAGRRSLVGSCGVAQTRSWIPKLHWLSFAPRPSARVGAIVATRGSRWRLCWRWRGFVEPAVSAVTCGGRCSKKRSANTNAQHGGVRGR